MSSHNPLNVTIVILANEYTQYLQETIESCKIQKSNYREIIVVRDEQINIPEVNQPIHLVTYKKSKMQGISKAITEAKGDYIAFITGGDLMIENRLQLQYDYLCKNANVGLVCGDMKGIDLEGKVCYESYQRQYGIITYEEEQTKHLVQTNFVSGSTIFMRKSIAELALPIPEALPFEDWWLGVIASLHSEVGIMKETLVMHRENIQQGQSLMTRKNFMQERVLLAKCNSIYYDAFENYFREGKHHYLSVIQPMALRDTLMSTYSIRKRAQYYYSERTYKCRRKIRWKEKIKIQAYLWMGPYLLLVKR